MTDKQLQSIAMESHWYSYSDIKWAHDYLHLTEERFAAVIKICNTAPFPILYSVVQALKR
jgi:hypothetical protein